VESDIFGMDGQGGGSVTSTNLAWPTEGNEFLGGGVCVLDDWPWENALNYALRTGESAKERREKLDRATVGGGGELWELRTWKKSSEETS